MSLEQNKELARAAIAIWSTGDFSRVLEIFTPDYVMHQHHHGAAGGTGGLGLKEMRAFAHEFRTGGRKLSWTGTGIDRVQDDRIVESWGNWDMMGMLQQLGAIPTWPGTAQAL